MRGEVCKEPGGLEINGLTCPGYYERKLAEVEAKLAAERAGRGFALLGERGVMGSKLSAEWPSAVALRLVGYGLIVVLLALSMKLSSIEDQRRPLLEDRTPGARFEIGSYVPAKCPERRWSAGEYLPASCADGHALFRDAGQYGLEPIFRTASRHYRPGPIWVRAGGDALDVVCALRVACRIRGVVRDRFTGGSRDVPQEPEPTAFTQPPSAFRIARFFDLLLRGSSWTLLEVALLEGVLAIRRKMRNEPLRAT